MALIEASSSVDGFAELTSRRCPTKAFDWPPELAADLEAATGGGDEVVLWSDYFRHVVLLARLQKPYFVYCVVCCFLASLAFISTLSGIIRSHRAAGGMIIHAGPGSWEEALEGGRWQSACWALVAFSLFAEVVGGLVVRGPRACLRDRWCALDAALLLLTVTAWALALLRRASLGVREEAEEADLTLLAFRFALQPCRVLATLKTTCKVQTMQISHADVAFDAFEGPQAKAV